MPQEPELADLMDKQIWWLWDIERAECLKVQDLSKQEERREEYLVVRMQSGLGFAFHSFPVFIVCGPEAALECPVRD